MSKLEIIMNLIIACLLLILGFSGIFFPKKIIDGTLYLIRTKEEKARVKFFKKLLEKKWVPLNIRISGIGLLIMASLLIWFCIVNWK